MQRTLWYNVGKRKKWQYTWNKIPFCPSVSFSPWNLCFLQWPHNSISVVHFYRYLFYVTVCILTSPLTHKHNCVDCSLTTVNQPLLFHHVVVDWFYFHFIIFGICANFSSNFLFAEWFISHPPNLWMIVVFERWPG